MVDSRGKLLYLIFAIGILILLIRAFYLQVFKWSTLNFEVQDLNTRIIQSDSQRGNIFDRNGKLLAWNEKLFQIYNLSEEIDKQTEELIREILKKTDLDLDSIIDKLNFQRKINLSINAALAKKLSNIKTLYVQEKSIRKYAHVSLYHILGYVDIEGNPVMGLEKIYDKILRGQPGYKIVNLTPMGKIKSTVEETFSIPGDDIYLTIDLDIQIKAFEELESSGYPGSIIVSDPRNGEIYALVSFPTPDPNMFSRGLTNLEYRRLSNNTKKPFINRGISALYPPGSVLKPFIALSALEAGLDPDKTIFSDGRYELKNSKGQVIGSFTDWNLVGHGTTDLIKSLKESVNSYYYWLGEKYGIDYLKTKSDFYNITGKTLIDLPGESLGIFPDQKWKKDTFNEIWYPGETLNAYIGQGYVLTTPIEILKFYNILASKGKYYKFHTFLRSSNTLEKESPVVYEVNLAENYQINNDYLSLILKGLKEVTTPGGTAYDAFKNFPVITAAKTGTAEVSGGKKPHGWFAAYMPADNPKYSIVVMVENVGYGSHVSAPIAKNVLDIIVKKGI
ncbi:MAG TPA: penicillin-binding transpeptidase domain-containing protein [Petrotogaceae bacterium]|nr:penicillin-binding transpeptidase domain-containing protein [Petrotogaceae bacterium]HQF32398.1 penicillin-binding transpeptidase domain-containing protein [Petrotogaceae bacterium]HQH32786.1 penicillin-binding transpeptidase domain-containing protein [Petrotogaceae bacterium]